MKLINKSKVEKDLVVEVKGDSIMIGVADANNPEFVYIVFEMTEDGYYTMRNVNGSTLEGYLVVEDDRVGFE